MLISLSLCLASNAYGQEVIHKGDPAPYDGVVYSVDTHAALVAKIKGFDAKCTAEKDYLTKKLELKYNLDISKLKIDNDTLQKQLEITEKLNDTTKKMLLKQIQDERIVPWYKSPQFNFWVGIGVATLVYGIVTWAVVKYGFVNKAQVVTTN